MPWTGRGEAPHHSATAVRGITNDGGRPPGGKTALGAAFVIIRRAILTRIALGPAAGNGNGFVVTASGQTATFTGHGVASFTGPGELTWRGALFYETTSDELSRLNGIAVLFEYQVADGKSEGRLFEWK